ncbi:amino acid ABC transporter permease [Parendozoicomonas haliclonae]|uniref:Putative glutamine ABC transporter permease protein GlnP n=1 Tax=Parendozoicomonas haliclonae TaxID=1960125 RepID=A0A1X7AI88_9GAMM|nr:amino acid ABC transporter permease [Parendozoicomonas haliclonae]SMA44334.1 putative glutamine ABC transporter permease protein GlnP [Parendozoicomonas haliclonae]
MNETVTFFSGFKINDLFFLGEAALQTLMIAAISISSGTLLGAICGWGLAEGKTVVRWTLNSILDVFRSVPLLIQLILFYNLFPIIGFDLGPFASGIIVLSMYTCALVASVVRGGIESVQQPMRRAARSLGMSYLQSMRHVIFPIGLRAVLPSWIGVALGVLKDSALVSVLGYVELLRASQILMTRTQEPFLILALAGAFYFALSYPLSRYSKQLEERWAS